MHYKIAQLILRGAEKKVGTTSDIYIAQPDFEKENLAGKLFFLVEIESKTANDLKIINFLIQDLERNYYNNEKIVLREKNENIKIEHIFELSLAKTNKNLNDFLSEEKIKFHLDSINAVIGVIHENNLYFASTGKTKAFLIYKENKEQKTAKNRLTVPEKPAYKIVNIIEHTGSDGQINPAKAFSNVISGSIPVGGYFVFTNEAISEYLTNRQLIDITTTLPPNGAVEQIKNILLQINSYVSFLGIIIKNTNGIYELEPRKEIASSTTHASISNLNYVEENTEKFLAPGGHISFRKILGKFIKGGKQESSAVGSLKDKIFFKKKPSFIFTYIFSTLQLIFSYLFGVLVLIFKTLTSKERLSNLFKNIVNFPDLAAKKIRLTITNTKLWLKNLSKLNKILFGITIACLAILIFNINFLKIKNKRIAEEKAISDIVQSIEQKHNQIEASLLYNNESEAKRLLPEIKALLSKLPQTNAKYGPLNSRYNEYLEKIRHAVKLNPQMIADFAGKKNPDNIMLFENSIVMADSGAKTISIMPLGSDGLTDVKIEASKLEMPAQDKNGILYYFDDKKVVTYNTKTKKTENVTINTQLSNLGGSVGFNGKLYVIDGSEIYSLAKKGGSFERTKWLKEPVNLDKAVSMDIDSNIYVLTSNGKIYKFLKGNQERFELDPVEPELDKPTRLAAKTDSNFIYVLEPAGKRIVVYDKNGKFLIQYVFEKEIKDFAVDEKNKTFYILSGTSIYKSGF